MDKIYINKINFPDKAFRDYIKNTFDSTYDKGFLTKDEIERVTKIELFNLTLDTLQGIEHFSNLKSLNCIDTNIENLDLSKNPKLEELFCYKINISQLNISNNPNLKHVDYRNANIKSIYRSNGNNLFFRNATIQNSNIISGANNTIKINSNHTTVRNSNIIIGSNNNIIHNGTSIKSMMSEAKDLASKRNHVTREPKKNDLER